MAKNRNIYFDGFRGDPIKLLTIREQESFKTYITLKDKNTAIATIKHGQKDATQTHKTAIKNLYNNSFDFEFDPEAPQKVWCKISIFCIKRNEETGTSEVQKKVYKTLELIDQTDDWQREWATCWLVFDDDSKLTQDKTKQALIRKYSLESINLQTFESENKPPQCLRIDLEQNIESEILRNYIPRSQNDESPNKIKLEIREIPQSNPTITIPEQFTTEEAYFYGGNYLSGERKLLVASSFFERR